jgi:hypothetical protein
MNNIIKGSRAVWGAALLLLLLPAHKAAASQFVDSLAPGAHIQLRVNSSGAMLYYTKGAGGAQRHVFVRGAINARFPTRGAKQVHFKLDYSGGYNATGRALWKSFQNECQPYDGPDLMKAVAKCKAPDGSYWAVQQWRVQLPDLGFPPWTVRQRSFDLRISHWTGDLAQLEVHSDWIYAGRFHEVFGRASYHGKPIFGFQSDSRGAPTDNFGRLVYLDTANSKYGRGWRRENSFLPHNPTGVFCYGFYKHNPLTGGYAHPPHYRGGKRGPGKGSMYRLTIIGPGVTPDVQSVTTGLKDFNRSNPSDVSYEQQQNAILDQLAAGGKQCHHH